MAISHEKNVGQAHSPAENHGSKTVRNTVLRIVLGVTAFASGVEAVDQVFFHGAGTKALTGALEKALRDSQSGLVVPPADTQPAVVPSITAVPTEIKPTPTESKPAPAVLTQQDIKAWEQTLGGKFTVSGNYIEGMTDVTLGHDTVDLTFHGNTYRFPRSDAKIGKDGNYWVAGYEWTGTEWQVILPGTEFPASPEELPTFSMEDIKNGNLLAWYEEVFEKTNAKDRFTGAIPTDKWKRIKNTFTFTGKDLNGDGKEDTVDYSMVIPQDVESRHDKRESPYRFSDTFVHVPDAVPDGAVFGFNDLLNANGTFAHCPTPFDSVLFSGERPGSTDILRFLSGYKPTYGVEVSDQLNKYFLEPVASYGSEATTDLLGGVSTVSLLQTESPMGVENERIVQETIDGDGNFDPDKVGRQAWGFLVTYYR